MFEEESHHHNHDALSASNGLALDLLASTSEFKCKGVGGVGRQKKEKAFQGRWCWVDLRGIKKDASFAHLEEVKFF